MFMARQPVQPPLNLPQAIVEFVTLVKDTSWLKPFVEAAQQVAKANALTEEEVANLASAQKVIEEAASKEKDLAAIAQKQAVTDQVQSAIAAKLNSREKQCDERNTSLGEFEESLNFLAEDLASKINALDHKDKTQLELATTLILEEQRLKAWAGELDVQQQNWDAARAMLTKKAS